MRLIDYLDKVIKKWNSNSGETKDIPILVNLLEEGTSFMRHSSECDLILRKNWKVAGGREIGDTCTCGLDDFLNNVDTNVNILKRIK